MRIKINSIHRYLASNRPISTIESNTYIVIRLYDPININGIILIIVAVPI